MVLLWQKKMNSCYFTVSQVPTWIWDESTGYGTQREGAREAPELGGQRWAAGFQDLLRTGRLLMVVELVSLGKTWETVHHIKNKGQGEGRWQRREWEMRAEAAMIKSKLECVAQTGSRPTVQREGCEQQEGAQVLLSCDAQCAALMWGRRLTETIKGWSTAKFHSACMKQRPYYRIHNCSKFWSTLNFY